MFDGRVKRGTSCKLPFEILIGEASNLRGSLRFVPRFRNISVVIVENQSRYRRQILSLEIKNLDKNFRLIYTTSLSFNSLNCEHGYNDVVSSFAVLFLRFEMAIYKDLN